MRHDNIEHRRLRPEPFTVEGDLAFVLRTFGLPEDMSAAAAEERFCSQEPLVCSITGKSCVVTTWECVHGDEPRYTLKAAPVYTVKRSDVPTFGSSPVYTTGPHAGKSVSNVDPWVKVGTTTIDGTLEQVAARVVGCNSIPKWVDSEGCERVIDEWMRDRAVLNIGGQHLRPCGSHINASRGTALIRCDIVRRQSEIDAEKCKRLCAHCETPSDTQFCEPCVAGFRAMEPPCPECGPHGNRGEVLLASSWAKCTTCAGGKPGDLWGEVTASEEPKYWSSVANKMVTFAEALAIGRSLRRPEDEIDVNVRREALRDLRGILLDRPDDMSKEDFRRMVLNGGTVP